MGGLSVQFQYFEAIKKNFEDGLEYWSARELMPLLGYNKWQNFSSVINKAQVACKNSGHNMSDHFTDTSKVIEAGKGAKHEIGDVFLTRYACYLIAQNGDPQKLEISLAQTYFAIQTRKQEITEQRIKEDKRLEERSKLQDIEKNIRATVYLRGVTTSPQFASFKDIHIKALYGGKSTKELKDISLSMTKGS